MRHVILANYGRYSDAQRARYDLIVFGFSSAEVEVALEEELREATYPIFSSINGRSDGRFSEAAPRPTMPTGHQDARTIIPTLRSRLAKRFWLIVKSSDEVRLQHAAAMINSEVAAVVTPSTEQSAYPWQPALSGYREPDDEMQGDGPGYTS